MPRPAGTNKALMDEDAAISPEAKPSELPGRIDYEQNYSCIKTFIDTFISENNRAPRASEIAKGVHLSRSTVQDHLQRLKSDASRFDVFRSSTEDVIIALFKSAKEGDARCIKLWLQFVESWEERKKITQVNQNPYANLSSEDIKKLAQKRRDAIHARMQALNAAKESGFGPDDEV